MEPVEANRCHSCCTLYQCFVVKCIDSVTEPAMPELFTAADDEWKCKNCGVQNGATSEECVKCQSGRLHVMSHMNYNIANEVSYILLR